jgi:hypothetical protein
MPWTDHGYVQPSPPRGELRPHVPGGLTIQRLTTFGLELVPCDCPPCLAHHEREGEQR